MVLAFVLLAADCGGPTGPSPADDDIVFLGSTPAPGSSVVIGDPRALTSRFSVLYHAPIAGAALDIELLDSAGTTCAFSTTSAQDVLAGKASTFVNDFLLWQWVDCPLPRTTSTLNVTLAYPGSATVSWTEYLTKSFAVGYSFEQYPPPPANVPPSAPRITEMGWTTTPSWGTPIPGDPTSIWCRVRDEDGDAVTVTLAVTWTGAETKQWSQRFPPGASSSSEGAYLSVGTEAGDPPTATFTCEAIDAAGNSATRTSTVP